jgi:hypothetical protein
MSSCFMRYRLTFGNLSVEIGRNIKSLTVTPERQHLSELNVKPVGILTE